MEDMITRFFENLLGRLHGPMHFRIYVQPLMAILFAILDGRKDALEGKAPYFWALFTEPQHRKELLFQCWKSVGKIFGLAILLDAAYQLWQLHWFYPGEALLVAFLLAIVPYVLLRGPASRIIARMLPKSHHAS
jgi:hypothetical protein